MKKCYCLRLLLVGLLLSLCLQSQAQDTVKTPEVTIKLPENFPPILGFGIKGGQEYFRVNFEPSLAQSFTPAYMAGILFRYISVRRAGLQVELNYTRRGWSAAEAANSRQWQYLELPLLTHVRLGQRRSSLFLNFGPWLSYRLSPPDTVVLETTTFQKPADFKNVPRPFQYGLSFGIGYSLRTPIGLLQLEGRVSHSLANALKGSSFTTSHYQVVGLNLAYIIQKQQAATKKR